MLIAPLLLLAPAVHLAADTIVIDATRSTPISPYIYGANFPDWTGIGLKFPLSRQGGNRMTAYNWENNASNAGNDYRNQNDGYISEKDEAGLPVREFLESSQAHRAATLLTVPMAGYVSADKGPDNDVNRTPDYLNVRFLKSLPRKPGKFTYPPDTKDRVVYQDELVHWIETIKKGPLPVWYSLDNEPDIWASTHSRIVLSNPTYADFIARSIDFAKGIKSAAPKSLIFGPASYGWQGFRRFQAASDANNRDFLDVYLAEMKDAEKTAGRRLLDVLDVHFYPEAKGGGTRITETPADGHNDEARIQAPRSLWDPTYVEDSWITQSLGGKPIALLPGIKAQITKHYPGTKLSITEYHYGGGNRPSGLLAQADVLGIYGRYGLFAACNWVPHAKDVAVISGFRAFLNYDGNGSQFGRLALPVTGETPAMNSVYAAKDPKSPNQLTLVVINKADAAQPFSISFRGFAPRQARGFVWDGTSLGKARSTTLHIGTTSQYEAPARSVTTFELRR